MFRTGRRLADTEEDLSMVEQVLVATGVVGLLLVITTGAVAMVALQRVRRRFRSTRELFVVVRRPKPSRRSLRAPSAVALATVGSPGWWMIQNRRHRMWKAISSAGHAVRVARRADVAVGDLPVLAAKLRAAAGGSDSVLRASARLGSVRPEDRADCDRIEAAAADIHAAALYSLRSVSHADTDPLVSAVQVEVAALVAGVRAAHY